MKCLSFLLEHFLMWKARAPLTSLALGPVLSCSAKGSHYLLGHLKGRAALWPTGPNKLVLLSVHRLPDLPTKAIRTLLLILRDTPNL